MKIGIVKHYPDGLSATPAFGIVKHYPDGLSATPAMVSTDLSVYTVMYKYVCIYIYIYILSYTQVPCTFRALWLCCIVEITVAESCLDTGTQCYMRCPDILKVILTLEPNATCVALTFKSYPDAGTQCNMHSTSAQTF